MPIDQEKIAHLLRISFPTAEITITDLVGDQNHYSLIIKDRAFVNMSRINQHKLVNEALRGYLGGDLHALSIKTLAK